MNPQQEARRPILVALTSHWLTMVGVTLVTLAGLAWVFLLPANIGGQVSNPYIGLLIFLAVPMVFFAGLVLIPAGLALGRRNVSATLKSVADPKAAWRRAGIFFAVMTFVNLIIVSQVSYRAVAYMGTVQFCGQTCHVMKPEFTAHLQPHHQGVACESCHISPGATGFVKAKMAGTNQLFSVIFNSYPRPIESAMENNKLVSSADTCEQCHARELVIGPRLKVVTKYKDDEANSRTDSVLMMKIGGGATGGIHGVHLGPGVRIRYAAADKKRQTIPWVEYRNTTANTTQTYLAAGTKPDAVPAMPVFEMQCVDCHNRAAHTFDVPDHAVDEAITSGRILASLPFVKKTGLALIQAPYNSADEANAKIAAGLAAFYREKYPTVFSTRVNDIQNAATALSAIYDGNVFPDLKVTWGTYPNNLGHMDSPGCFRCHDDSHVTADKKSITQDCNACHQSLAMDETSPPILKTLGLDDTTAAALKH
jgi:hypothetical protein